MWVVDFVVFFFFLFSGFHGVLGLCTSPARSKWQGFSAPISVVAWSAWGGNPRDPGISTQALHLRASRYSSSRTCRCCLRQRLQGIALSISISAIPQNQGALKGDRTKDLGDRESPKRRFSQKTADFRSFTLSPGNSSIWKAQQAAGNRRFSQETADWALPP